MQYSTEECAALSRLHKLPAHHKYFRGWYIKDGTPHFSPSPSQPIFPLPSVATLMFKIEIAEEEATKMQSVKDAVTFIESNL